MRLIERMIVGIVVAFVGLGLVSAVLPLLIPYLVGIFVMVIIGRLVWFYTRW